MIRTYTYKLYSNQQVERKFYQWLGTCRYVYNSAKAAKEYAYEAGITLNKYDLIKQLPACKDLDFVKAVHSQTLQEVVERLDRSFKNFFSKRAKYPKWASRRRWSSFTFKQGIKQTLTGFKLPKFGTVRVFNNRKIDGKIKTASLVKKADGIYLHVVCELADRTYCTNDNQVGIDVGIAKFITLSDGSSIENLRFLENKLSKLRVAQRSLSRKIKGSNRRFKQINKVARLHKSIRDTRSDFLHKVSTQIATQYKSVAIEDLNIRSMVRSDLSSQISDVAWGRFFNLLEYKSTVIKVSPSYTSQTCNKCGDVNKENRPSQSEFKCLHCGHTANADVNAALNIEGRAFPDSRQRGALARA